MSNVTIYTTSTCPFCLRAKQLLDSKQVKYEEIRVDNDPALRAKMTRLAGRRTVPQIFIDNQPFGGCDDLYALEAQGRLDTLLNQ